MPYKVFCYSKPFELESGYVLPAYRLGYHTYGQLSKRRDNVVWIFHALTANSDAATWWHGLVGEGKLFDPEKHFIVCVNMPGSCYGSTGPLEKICYTNTVLYHDFPLFTIRDMVRAYEPLRRYLGIDKIYIGIGGSMGGQQLLEWAIAEPQLFQYVFPIATNAIHSPWAKAFNASQRWCIESDPTWKQQSHGAGIEGMKIARSLALLSYRHYDTYCLHQTDADEDLLQLFKSETYQRYQGEKLAGRFNAFSYYKLSQSMDTHNVGRRRGGLINALQQIVAKVLVIGIDTDILFPPSEQKFLADGIKGASLSIIHSNFGHDGFLLEFDAIEKEISTFMNEEVVGKLNSSRSYLTAV